MLSIAQRHANDCVQKRVKIVLYLEGVVRGGEGAGARFSTR